MSQPSVGYTVGFAAAVCVVCSILVSGAAVSLKDRQDANKLLDKQKKVLTVAGLMQEGEKLSREEIQSRFTGSITARAVDMKSGTYVDGVDPDTYDMRKASKDPASSFEAPENTAKVQRMANNGIVYQVKDEAGQVDQLILPIQGPGLWSTLYGFLCVERDTNTVCGITFYEHGETPGLGGEVDNPSWKKLWPGRKIYGDSGEVQLRVVKGSAGSVDAAPHKVDGLSGATITSNGVTNTLQYWLGPDGFGPYLENFRNGRASG